MLERPLSLKSLNDVAAHVDATREKRTTKTAAGIHEGCMVEFRDSEVIWVPASEDTLEPVKTFFQPQEAWMPPPEGVRLALEVQVWIDASVGEEKGALVIIGRALHRHDE